MTPHNTSLHRTPDASVTRLAFATRAPAAGAAQTIDVIMKLIGIAASILAVEGSVVAADFKWPELPSSGFVRDRAATDEDLRAGNAVFVLKLNGALVGVPLGLSIPQYAIHVDADTGKETPVIIVQAETNGEIEAIGYYIIGGGEHGVSLSHEFRFLGTEKPEK